MKTSLYKKLAADFENSFGANYQGETDIAKVLDLRRYKDDLDGLIEEMVQQPAIYAYWANLRRVAEDHYNNYLQRMELYKASKVKRIVEILQSQGVKSPTVKMIDTQFHREYKNDELYQKYSNTLKLWKDRKETLVILEKAVQSRESQFRSLTYLMANMMNAGLMTRGKMKLKTHNKEI